jgi:hypothetical protein
MENYIMNQVSEKYLNFNPMDYGFHFEIWNKNFKYKPCRRICLINDKKHADIILSALNKGR